MSRVTWPVPSPLTVRSLRHRRRDRRGEGEPDNVVAGLKEAGVKAKATVRVELSPIHALLTHIKEFDPDCVAIATQGRGLAIFVGSVADKLIRGAQRPVLVLRPMKD